MRISDFLRSDCIIGSMQASSKDEALSELLAPILGANPRLDKKQIFQTILDREKLGSTGLGGGVAIPHGKFEGLEKLTASFGRSQKGIDFSSMDNKPAYLFFMLIAPKNCAGDHLKALARISRIFKDPLLTNNLKQAENSDQIFKLLEESDLKFP
ncbi:MAG: PTS sugar transporter subunit IIA [Deltaproteobacteria bacterium]|nr:PTS sugar transporter subunit IIA [Deltaproteobacteria bacterium]